MNKQVQSRFITFEGIDRSGKSTQTKQLKRNLDKAGVRCIVTSEPGGSGQIGATIREMLMNPDIKRNEITAALLFNADRHEHVTSIIQPTLAKGIWVICDRFYDSTMAYQGAGGGVDRKFLEDLNRISCGDLRPDMTILLRGDVDHRLLRSPRLDYYDQGHKAFEKRVSKYFDDIATAELDRFVSIDGSGTVEEVGEAIFAEVKHRFLD